MRPLPRVIFRGAPEAGTFTYDDLGNMTGDGTGTFTYTTRNLMQTATIGSTTTDYGYDADGLRKIKSSGSTTKYYIHGLGSQLLAEYDVSTGVPAIVKEYVYLGGRLLASFAPDESPAAVARVTGVAVSSANIVAGTQVTVTVAGEALPCPSVQINFGDGTTTSYPLTSPYALPLQVTHTYTTAGLRTIIATGETTGNGPCAGTVSTPIAVRSAEAMTNGDFSQGLNGSGLPVGWNIFSGGTALAWSLTTGLEFYRPAGSTTGVVEETTSLGLPAGAPLEATFTLGNSDTVSKRVSVIMRSSAWNDLALCNFHLAASQSAQTYTMRMHTTVSWSAAAIAFYAADVNGSGTGSYQLDNVSLVYKPASSSAKTDCADPNAPTSGGSSGSSLLTNGDFSDSTTGWTLSGSMTSGVVSEVLEYYRTTGSTTPVVGQATSTSVAANQRLTAIFEMGNSSTSRQRVTVSLQESDASSFVSCVFWLPAGTERRAYAMTTFAPVAWTSATWAVVPSNGGSEGSHGWLELDTVSFAKTTDAVLGTECFEPGSFTISEGAAGADARAGTEPRGGAGGAGGGQCEPARFNDHLDDARTADRRGAQRRR